MNQKKLNSPQEVYFSPLTKRRPKPRLTCMGCRRLQTSARLEHVPSATGRNGQHDPPFLYFSFFSCKEKYMFLFFCQITFVTNMEFHKCNNSNFRDFWKKTPPLLFTGYDLFLCNALYFDF